MTGPIVVNKQTLPQVLPNKWHKQSRGNTTPSVEALDVLAFVNTAPVTVTDLLGGQPNQRVVLLGDGFTTLAVTGNIVTNTGASKLLVAGDIYEVIFYSDSWLEFTDDAGGGGGTGDVVGPAVSVDSNLASYDGITGKLIKDSGIAQTNVIIATGSYADPAWLTSLAYAKLTGAPSLVNYVVGPASATDNAITRYDGATGKLVQDSLVIIDDTGILTTPSTLQAFWPTGITTAFDEATDGFRTTTRFKMVRAGQGPFLAGCRVNGTLSVPTQVLANELVFTLEGRGLTDVGTQSSGLGQIQISAREDLTATAQGGQISFSARRIGTVLAEALFVFRAGGAGIAEIVGTSATLRLIPATSIVIRDAANTLDATTFSSLGAFTTIGPATVSDLAGVGSRMVVASALGVLSTAAIPTGDVVGPAGATDNALARYDGATGKLIQDSLIIIDDSGNIATPGNIVSSYPTAATSLATLWINTPNVDYAASKLHNLMIVGEQISPDNVSIGTNFIWSGSGVSMNYIQGGYATRIQFDNFRMRFEASTGGSAGTAISWIRVFEIDATANSITIGGAVPSNSTYALFAASTTAKSALRIPSGVAPTIPVDGNLWGTSVGLFYRMSTTRRLDATVVRKNTGADVGEERRLNFIEGSNITLTIADDAANDEIDITIAASGGGGGGTTGTTTVDFGTAGKTDATVVITGQASIVAGSRVEAWIECTATADHTIEEHALGDFDVRAGNISAGVGFTIYAVSRVLTQYRTFTIGWRWT